MTQCIEWKETWSGWEAEIGDEFVTLERVVVMEKPMIRVFLEGVFWFDLTPLGSQMTSTNHESRIRWSDLAFPKRFELIARVAVAQSIMDGPMKELEK